MLLMKNLTVAKYGNKKIKLNFPLTAGEAHEVLKTEIISLFNENGIVFSNLRLKPFLKRKMATFTLNIFYQLLK